MHAEHAGIQGICPVKGAFAHQCIGNRSVDFFYKFSEFFRCVREHGSTAHKYKRFFGRFDQFNGLPDIHFFDIINLSFDFFWLVFFIIRDCCRHILRNVDEDRPFSSGLGNPKCPSDRVCKVFYILDNKVMFCDGKRDPCNVYFLEAVLSEKIDSYITCNRHHRDRIHICGCNPRNNIRRSRTGSCKTHAYLSGGSGITVRRMGSALLMSGKNMVKAVLLLI